MTVLTMFQGKPIGDTQSNIEFWDAESLGRFILSQMEIGRQVLISPEGDFKNWTSHSYLEGSVGKSCENCKFYDECPAEWMNAQGDYCENYEQKLVEVCENCKFYDECPAEWINEQKDHCADYKQK